MINLSSPISQSKGYGQIGMPGVLAQVVRKSGPDRTPMALRHARAAIPRQGYVDAQTRVSAYLILKPSILQGHMLQLKHWMTMYPKLAPYIFGWASPTQNHRNSGLGSVVLRT